MVAMKLQRRPQAPVRIELTTPGLRDQCSCHWAMKPEGCSFWLRKSGVPLFMWFQRRELLPPTSLERGLKSGRVVQVMVAVKLQGRAQAPVRIELTTPGLLDQCSNHWAMKPQSCSFWLRKSGVPLFMWCQRRQRLPPTSKVWNQAQLFRWWLP